MPLLTCKLCGKLFTSPGGRTCPTCLARLDELYPKVREYLRDNPKTAFNVEAVAEEMEVDIRDVQGLVDQGYLDRDIGRQVNPAEIKRQQLARELESSLKQMKDASAAKSVAKNTSTTYAQQRYGDYGEKKR